MAAERVSESELILFFSSLQLATLADQLSDFVQLLQSTAEPSQTSTPPIITPSHLHTPTRPLLHTPHKTRDETTPLLPPPGSSATESALHAPINGQWRVKYYII